MEPLRRVSEKDFATLSMENELLRYEVGHLRARIDDVSTQLESARQGREQSEEELSAQKGTLHRLRSERDEAIQRAMTLDRALSATRDPSVELNKVRLALARAEAERAAAESEIERLRGSAGRLRRDAAATPGSPEGDLVALLGELEGSALAPLLRRRPAYRRMVRTYCKGKIDDARSEGESRKPL